MTDEREPATAAGRFLAAGLEALGFAEDDANERILAIEAEASVPAAPLTPEALAEAMFDVIVVRGNPFTSQSKVQVASSILARLLAAPPAPQPDEALRAVIDWGWWQHADVCDYGDPCQCGFSKIDGMLRAALAARSEGADPHD